MSGTVLTHSHRHRRSRVDIIITGGGHVQSNRGRRVIAECSEVIDPAADALAAAAALPGCAAVGLVEFDRAADECDVGRADGKAPSTKMPPPWALPPFPPAAAVPPVAWFWSRSVSDRVAVTPKVARMPPP